MLVAYVALLILSAIRSRTTNSPTDVSLWKLQDTRQLLVWIRHAAWSGLFEAVRYLPVGFLVPLAFSSTCSIRRRIFQSFALVLLALGLTIVVASADRAIVSGGPLFDAPLAMFLLPGIGCLLGAWIGMNWIRGWVARLWLGPKLFLLIGIVGAAIVGLGWMAIEDTPLSFEPAHVTSAEKRRLVELVREKDPRDVEPGQEQTLCLTNEDLDLLLAWALTIGSGQRKARVELTDLSATLQCSVGLPFSGAKPRFINVTLAGQAQLDSGQLRLRASRLRIGRIVMPNWLLAMLSQTVTAEVHRDRHLNLLVESIRKLEIEPNGITVTYERVDLPRGFVAEVFDRLRPAGAIREPARVHVQHLLSLADRLPGGEARFGACLEAAFTLAQERSRDGDPVLENRAAIFALATLLGHSRVQTFVGSLVDQESQPDALRVLNKTTLRGRSDWVKHFLVSAALSLISSEAASDATGLLKEELDAGEGGSGFSFADLLADRAGTTFALVATRDPEAARAMQRRLAKGFHSDDFFPPAEDLPEGIPDAELQRRYGGVGGEDYLKLVEEIERRVAACPAYR